MRRLSSYKTFIWDWNGTIVDDTNLCYEIYTSEAERYGLKAMSIDEYRRGFSFPVEDFYREVGFSHSRDEYQKVSERFGRIYASRCMECSIHSGVREMLQMIEEIGGVSHIISAYKQSALRAMVDGYDLSDLFASVNGLSTLEAGSKIDFALSLKDEGLFDPEETIYFGDTVHDWEVASELGVDCVLLSHGTNSEDRLKRDCSGAGVFSSFAPLLDRMRRG